MSGRDSLIDVGTGYGKTLCMIIPCLLDPESLAVIFSPLKRLQAVQVLEFEHYGIKTLAINEDTPNVPDLWKVRPRFRWESFEHVDHLMSRQFFKTSFRLFLSNRSSCL
jgi:RAD3-like DEAD/DEAH box helicase